jgi:SSS family solute:Na+ symporter
VHTYPSELAQTFWTAIVAFSTCFIVTILVSLVTTPRAESELKGLVYSLTPRPPEEKMSWVKRPHVLAIGVLAMTFLLNLIFR